MTTESARCENCRFWKMHAPDTHHGGGERAGDDFASWGNCERQNSGEQPLLFFSLDSSDYSSWIVTHKDFGCVGWTPR